jgi:hypothetical protein
MTDKIFQDIVVDADAGSVVLKFERSEELNETISKNNHDITAAVRTFEMAVESFKNGYKFEDQLASAKISSLEKSVAAVKGQLELLSAIYEKMLD